MLPSFEQSMKTHQHTINIFITTLNQAFIIKEKNANTHSPNCIYTPISVKCRNVKPEWNLFVEWSAMKREQPCSTQPYIRHRGSLCPQSPPSYLCIPIVVTFKLNPILQWGTLLFYTNNVSFSLPKHRSFPSQPLVQHTEHRPLYSFILGLLQLPESLFHGHFVS